MNKPPKITYLLGAGASYNALPIVSEIPNKLREMKEYIEQFNFDKTGEHIKLDVLENEINLIEKHASIDTLARKYWLKHQKNFTNEDYLFVKNIITCLLIYCQLETNKVANQHQVDAVKKVKKNYLLDPRYDAFLSAIIKDDFQLPPYINIVSWNYDYQIEKSFNFFSPEKTLMETGQQLGIDYYSVIQKSNIIKLNGTGFFVDKVNPYLNYNEYNDELHELFFKLLIKKNKSLAYSGIKFAWETNSDLATSNRENAANNVIAKSDYIIIIGYSFPIFNREVDIKLFEKIENCKAIYIQDKPERIELIQNQLDSINPKINQKKLVKSQTNLDQFLIPNELWAPKAKGVYRTIKI
jgi:hypothetical protein